MVAQFFFRCLAPVGIFFLFSFSIQAQVYLHAEIRPRTEYRNGYTTLRESSYNPAFFISQRTRLGLEYKNENLAFKITAQDVRTWGDEEQVKDVPALGIYEAWVEVIFSETLKLRLGRQELAYDDQRILGNLDWVQAGRVHDGVVLKAIFKGYKLDLGGAFNQEKDKIANTDFALNNYKALGFVWINKTFFEKLNVSILEVSDGFQARDSIKDVLFRHTLGVSLTAISKQFEVREALYGQSGKDIGRKDISAFMNAFSVSYSYQKFKFTLGCDYLSGTDQLNIPADKNHTFNTLYATNHKFYGFMDYFLNIPKDTKNGGLHNPYFKLNFNPTTKLSTSIDCHYFALAKKIPSSSNSKKAADKYLGSEIDFSMNYKLNDQVGLQGGYSILSAGDSMKEIKTGSNAHLSQWGWLMLTIKPNVRLGL